MKLFGHIAKHIAARPGCLLLGVFLVLTAAGLRAQDPVFSQFFANPMRMNPAMTGMDQSPRVFMSYRNQWAAAVEPYVSYQASYEQYLEKMQGALGFALMNDRQGGGVLNDLSLDAIYAYRVKVQHDLSVSAGLQATLGNRSLRASTLVLPEQLLMASATTLQDYSRFYLDFAFGIAAHYKRIYGGVALHHPYVAYFTPIFDENQRRPIKYTAHFGALIPVFEKRLGREVMKLAPQLIFTLQDIYQQFSYGVEARLRGLQMGVWMRQDLNFSYGALILSAGYQTGSFGFRYAYDAKFSSPELHLPNMASHELSVALFLGNMKKSTGPGTIKYSKF